MSGDDKYKDMLDNVWPPPSEETRARLQRLQDLEEQRRQRLTSQQRTRSSSLDRGPSSSRELLFGSRSGLNRAGSFRSSGRRLTYQRPTVSSSSEDRSRSLHRSVSEQADDHSSSASSVVPISSSASAINLSSSSSETEKSEGKDVKNVSKNLVPDNAASDESNSINVNAVAKDLSASDTQTNSDLDKSITTDDNNETTSVPNTAQNTEQSRVADASLSAEAKPDPTVVVAQKDDTACASEDGTVKQSAKNSADTEIEISSQQWSVSEDTDRKLQDIMSDKEARLAKLKELENLRLQGSSRVQEPTPDDMGMSARERFNLNYSANVRPQRQLSLREQIRRERRARRHSDLQLSSTSTFGTDQTGSTSSLSSADETSVGAPRERTTRAMNPDAWDAAFSGDREERMKRMKELDRMRKEGRGSSFDTDQFSRDAYQPTYDYSSHSMFPLSSSRQSESMSSLLSSRRPLELPLQFSSIREQREPSLFSSSSTLARASSTQDVLARARETLSNVPLRRAASTTETRASDYTEQSSAESRNQTEELSVVNEESDEVPVYVEGAPQGVPYVDDQGHTHWLGPTSPKYNELVSQSPSRSLRAPTSPHSTVMSMRETDDDPIRARQRNRGLPPEIQDHYLAECFDPKYTLKERIVLIRKKLWGDPPQIPSFERGNPDGASHGEGTGGTPAGTQAKDDVTGSEGTKTI